MIKNTYNSIHGRVVVAVTGMRRRTRWKFFIEPSDTQVAKLHTWTRSSAGYPICSKCQVLLHRLLTGAADHEQVDHINRDRRDCRRRNLRVATVRQNSWNMNRTTRLNLPVSGVFPRGDRWLATIRSNDTTVRLGVFDDVYDAVMCRVRAEYERRGIYSQDHRSWLPTVPKLYLDHWLPEIYSTDNKHYVNGEIWKAHYKGEWIVDTTRKRQQQLHGLQLAGTKRGGVGAKRRAA